MSILTRDEFHERMLAYGGDVAEYNSTDIRTFAQGRAVDTSAGRVMAAYDAALARIAELEAIHGKAFALAPGAHEVIAECSTWHDGCHCTSETLAHNIKRADEAEAALKSPAYRARIAREFLGELTFRYTDIDLDKSAFDCFLAVLDEWEAAAKEGK